MSRAHIALLSLLLGLATCAGAVAVLSTSALGEPDSKPEVAAAAAIAKRERALDRWEASLDHALVSRPPGLPPLPRYPGIKLVQAQPGRALPKPAAAPVSKAASARAAAVRTEPVIAKAKPVKQSGGSHRPPHQDDPTTTPATPVAPPSAPQAPAAPAVTPAQAPPAQAPSPPAPRPASGESAKRSAEQQCEALKQAAEGKGEAAKQAAERQCEALKNAAEGG